MLAPAVGLLPAELTCLTQQCLQTAPNQCGHVHVAMVVVHAMETCHLVPAHRSLDALHFALQPVRTSAKHSIALDSSLSQAKGKSGLALLQDCNALSGATHFLVNLLCSSAERGSGRETGGCDLLNHHIKLTALRAPHTPHCCSALSSHHSEHAT